VAAPIHLASGSALPRAVADHAAAGFGGPPVVEEGSAVSQVAVQPWRIWGLPGVLGPSLQVDEIDSAVLVSGANSV
jgi:hypothetical protein